MFKVYGKQHPTKNYFMVTVYDGDDFLMHLNFSNREWAEANFRELRDAKNNRPR